MKKSLFKLLSGILCLILLISTAGCLSPAPAENIDILALTDTLLTQVRFDTPLSDTGADSSV